MLTLARWFSGLERDLQATILRLGLLTLEDLNQLFEGLANVDEWSIAGQSQRASLEEFSKWLFVETRGQPFYVMETLKVLLERGVLTSHLQNNGKWAIDFEATVLEKTKLRSILPPNVREVIRLRLVQLTSSAFALLAAFAVLGHNSAFEDACQVAGLSESDGLVALDELLISYNLTEDTLVRHEKSGNGPPSGFSFTSHSRTYYFTHDKIRDVVYSEAGEARRRLFHRRALDVLQTEGDNKNRPYAAELARHAFAAGMIEPAFRFSVKAGDDSMSLFAVRDAITQYEQALHILQRDESEKVIQMQINAVAPASTLEHLYLQSGRAYEIVNEFEKARNLYNTLRLIARDLNSKTMDCAAINRLAMLAIFERYDIEQASILLNEALPLAKQDGDSTLLAETEWNIAQVNFHAWKANVSLIHGKRALELARKLGLQELSGRSLNVLAYSRLLVGKWNEAEHYAEEGRSLYSTLNNRAMEVDCLCQIAFARICRGQLFEGVSTAQEALSISRSIENTWGQVYSAYHIAMGLLEIGSFSEALFYAQRAVINASTDKLDVFVCINLAMTGRVHRAMLNLEAAISAHKEALTMNESMKAPWTEMITSDLCVDYAMSDDWANAYTYAKQALNYRRHSPYFYVGLTQWFETEALTRAGDIELATEDVKSFGEHFAHDRRFRIPYLRSLAVLARYRGEIEQAITYLQEAEKVADEIELPGELWSIKAALGELYLALDNEELASHAFTQAAVIVRNLSNYLENGNQRVNFFESPMVRRILETSSS
ncbi:MAG: ATP-binding protein [Ktedonobacteraceae bacterium]